MGHRCERGKMHARFQFASHDPVDGRVVARGAAGTRTIDVQRCIGNGGKMWRRARQPMGCGRLLSSPLNRSSWTDPAPGEHPVLLYSGPASDAHASRLPDAPLQRLHSTTKPPPPSAARPAQRWPQSRRHHWQILICSVHGDSHLPTLHCMILTDDSQNGGWEERASINYVEKKYTIHNVTAFYPLQTSLRCGRCP